jgi:hypothetical protein
VLWRCWREGKPSTALAFFWCCWITFIEYGFYVILERSTFNDQQSNQQSNQASDMYPCHCLFPN